MSALWIALLCLVIAGVAVSVGVAFVTRITSLFADERDAHPDSLIVDGVYLPGAVLFFLVAGNAWCVFSRSGLDSSAAASVLFIVLLWLLAYIDAHTTILPDVLTGLLAASGLALRLSGLHGRWDDVGAYFAMGLGISVPLLINGVYRWFVRRRLRGAGGDLDHEVGPEVYPEVDHEVDHEVDPEVYPYVGTEVGAEPTTDAIGQGDAKLLAGMGIWLGLYPLGVVIMSAAWLSLLYTLWKGLKNRRLPVAVPLGPFLALAGNIWILKHV